MLYKSLTICCLVLMCNVNMCKSSEIVSSVDDYLISSMTQFYENIIKLDDENSNTEIVIEPKEEDEQNFTILYSGFDQAYRYLFDQPSTENIQLMKRIDQIQEKMNDLIYYVSNLSVSLFCMFILLLLILCSKRQNHTRTLVVTDPPPVHIENCKEMSKDVMLKV